ncbi:MAG: DUF4328 domain-containing protein [Armatimonas sp.]
MKPTPQFTDLSRLTKALRTWYVIAIAISIELVVENLRVYWIVSHPQQYQFTSKDMAWHGLITLSDLLLKAITFILFMVWVFKSYRNAKIISPDATTSPAMAVVYYYIPFLSFYKPYQKMQEVWKICTSPSRWQSEKGSSLVAAWWWLYLLSSLVEAVARRAEPGAKETDLTVYGISYLINSAACLLNAITYGLAALLIGRLWERMKSLSPTV